MMPGFRVHVTVGLFLYPAVFLLYRVLFPSYSPAVEVLLLSYVFYIFGTDLPDVDSEAAPVRWFVHSLFPMIFLYLLHRMGLDETLTSKFGSLYGSLFYVALSVLLGFLSGYVLKLLSHRGFLHTLSFTFLYSLSVYLLLRLHFTEKDSLFVAYSAGMGPLVHLLLDYKGLKAFKRWW